MLSGLVAVIMVTCVVPFMVSEDSDALIHNSNMALNSDRAIIYVNSSTDHSFTFSAQVTDNVFLSEDSIKWKLNDLDDGDDLVSFNDTVPTYTASGTTVTVYAKQLPTGKDCGSIELEAYLQGDEVHHHATAVIVVLNSPSTPATEFHFWFNVYNDPTTQGYVQTYGNSTVNSSSPDNWTNGFWVTVTAEEVLEEHPTWAFNAKTALDYAVENHSGWVITYFDYGWINTFMGLGTYGHDIYEGGQYVSTTYYYWAQYHCDAGDGTWAFNNTTLEFITSQDQSYIGMVFWGSPSATALPNLPTSLP
jgi:hypothetical protein